MLLFNETQSKNPGGDILNPEKISKQRNLLLTIRYVGTNYHGFQIQKNAFTVQESFQNTLSKIIFHSVDIKGCSRTDSGVHANMYCLNFKTSSNIPCERLTMALNRNLPSDIAVLDCREVSSDFHARYSCLGKEYVYKIWNHKIRNPFLNNYVFHYWYPIDVPLLNNAAQHFIGTHDFTSFCTLDSRNQKNMVRTVKNFEIIKEDSLVIFKVEADGFLYNMVRIMAGTLLHIAQGKILPEKIKEIIMEKNRKKAGPTAVAKGLYLNKIFYQ